MSTASDRMLVILSRWRVNLATVLAVVAVAAARPTHADILRWLPLVLTGVAIRVWARGHLDRRARLTRTGPYAWVRHPLYVGSFLIGLGFSGMLGRWFMPPLFAATYLFMYVPKAIREEQYLRGKYGEEYARYAARTGAVIPLLRRPPAAADDVDAVRFEWPRVIGHREWKTWLGVAGAVAALWAIASVSSSATDIAALASRSAGATH
jgi:protein-S-isoprenylcysteine O-methyltransferase Ste14